MGDVAGDPVGAGDAPAVGGDVVAVVPDAPLIALLRCNQAICSGVSTIGHLGFGVLRRAILARDVAFISDHDEGGLAWSRYKPV